jgi:hypothetical protein
VARCVIFDPDHQDEYGARDFGAGRNCGALAVKFAADFILLKFRRLGCVWAGIKLKS